ncbi:MAG: tRNA 4-thiouridine(8) synthase ThiI [Oscillospiraceae bacterium]|jgi:thiamine biosynthesis protein ThiI|nr:tRNA 4-thiouridine(8) synthase ThiI [Oscillospiraceae bacterium]
MQYAILLKQGEIVLKGQNRRAFEARLEANVRRAVLPFGAFDVYSKQSVVYVTPQAGADAPGAFEACRDVFGIVSLSLCAVCGKDMDEIYETARQYLEKELTAAKSFKVEARRADKAFPKTSIEISQDIGGRLSDEFPHLAVDVHNPELTVKVEIREEAAFLHGNPALGAGGLPVGSSGRAALLLSGGIDSPVAGYLAAKRGLSVFPLHFFSYPYTSNDAKEKVLSLARRLTRFGLEGRAAIVPFTRVQEAIAKGAPDELGTILTRRFMSKIAEAFCGKFHLEALITGENLGQVASQTLQSLAVTAQNIALPVLRPLICYDKREITEIARKIGTFEISSLPYEDCCTVFTPQRPATKPKLERVLAAEKKLPFDELVAEAVSAIEVITFS